MVTKGEIQSIDILNNTCTVRIPLFETAGVNKEFITKATIAIQPGVYNGYTNGDIVMVAFEDGSADAPVVIGKLYLGYEEENKKAGLGAINCSTLDVKDSLTIPGNTKLSFSATDKKTANNKGLSNYKTIADLATAISNSSESSGSNISVSATGTATEKVNYITIDGIEKKIGGSAELGVISYNDLTDKPKINGVEIGADVPLEALGLSDVAITGDFSSLKNHPDMEEYATTLDVETVNDAIKKMTLKMNKDSLKVKGDIATLNDTASKLELEAGRLDSLCSSNTWAIDTLNNEIEKVHSEYSDIEQTTNKIALTVYENDKAAGERMSKIEQTADEIKLSVENYTTGQSSLIQQTASNIRMEVSEDLKDKVNSNDNNDRNTFGWNMTTDGVTFYDECHDVLKIDERGIEVSGTIRADAGLIGCQYRVDWNKSKETAIFNSFKPKLKWIFNGAFINNDNNPQPLNSITLKNIQNYTFKYSNENFTNNTLNIKFDYDLEQEEYLISSCSIGNIPLCNTNLFIDDIITNYDSFAINETKIIIDCAEELYTPPINSTSATTTLGSTRTCYEDDEGEIYTSPSTNRTYAYYEYYQNEKSLKIYYEKGANKKLTVLASFSVNNIDQFAVNVCKNAFLDNINTANENFKSAPIKFYYCLNNIEFVPEYENLITGGIIETKHEIAPAIPAVVGPGSCIDVTFNPGDRIYGDLYPVIYSRQLDTTIDPGYLVDASHYVYESKYEIPVDSYIVYGEDIPIEEGMSLYTLEVTGQNAEYETIKSYKEWPPKFYYSEYIDDIPTPAPIYIKTIAEHPKQHLFDITTNTITFYLDINDPISNLIYNQTYELPIGEAISSITLVKDEDHTGFHIGSESIWNNKNSLMADEDGIYLGANPDMTSANRGGISLGKLQPYDSMKPEDLITYKGKNHSTFEVWPDGTLFATKGYISKDLIVGEIETKRIVVKDSNTNIMFKADGREKDENGYPIDDNDRVLIGGFKVDKDTIIHGTWPGASPTSTGFNGLLWTSDKKTGYIDAGTLYNTEVISPSNNNWYKLSDAPTDRIEQDHLFRFNQDDNPTNIYCNCAVLYSFTNNYHKPKTDKGTYTQYLSTCLPLYNQSTQTVTIQLIISRPNLWIYWSEQIAQNNFKDIQGLNIKISQLTFKIKPKSNYSYDDTMEAIRNTKLSISFSEIYFDGGWKFKDLEYRVSRAIAGFDYISLADNPDFKIYRVIYGNLYKKNYTADYTAYLNSCTGKYYLGNGYSTGSRWILPAKSITTASNTEFCAIYTEHYLPNDWAFAIKNNFGITTDGIAYMANCKVNGDITANSGKIGALTITESQLTGQNYNLDELGLDFNGNSSDDSGIWLRNGAKLRIINSDNAELSLGLDNSDNKQPVISSSNGGAITFENIANNTKKTIVIVGNPSTKKFAWAEWGWRFWYRLQSTKLNQNLALELVISYGKRSTYTKNIIIPASADIDRNYAIDIDAYELSEYTVNGFWVNLDGSDGTLCGYPDSGRSDNAKQHIITHMANNKNIKITGNLIPAESNCNLGANTDTGKWDNVYANSGPWGGSDRNIKNSINSLSNAYEQIFDNLKPVSYKFNNGTSNRTHVGFIAQDVEQSILTAGLTTKDYACIAYDTKEDPKTGETIKENYMLRYEEFIALNTDQIQKLKKEVAELKAEIRALKNQ